MSFEISELKTLMLNFSITVTSQCNLNCSYCHFYENNKHRDNRDIAQNVFEGYVEFIKWVKGINSNIHYRFSGGEPLAIGDRVFELAGYATKQLGEAPYIMTNGLALNETILEKSKGIVRAYVISMENPFDVDKGSINTKFNIKKIQKYSSKELPLIPGAVIIKNHEFKNLYKLAKYFFESIGRIPVFTELSYGSYQSPTDSELNDLYEGIQKIVEEYHGKTRLRLFPYIIPEYLQTDTKQMEIITELDYEDKYDILNSSFNSVLKKMIKVVDDSYVSYKCSNLSCDWREGCKKVKWTWCYRTNQISIDQKLADYCRMKKAISKAYYDGIQSNRKAAIL